MTTVGASVQRCGPTPCTCSDDERAEYDATHPGEHVNEDDEGVKDQPGVTMQRLAVGPVTVQRHAGFRTKPRLEVPELAPLQFASSRADRALEFGKSNNQVEVTRLQEGLTKAGFAVPVTGTYDAATKTAVAQFQSTHGIPFPSGLQAGPKTLSTLDDHLLGGPKPKPECTQYQPGERRASFGPGRSAPSGSFKHPELRLFDFAAGVHLMKLEHQQAVKEFISKFDLGNPDPCQQQFVVESVVGFTDPIDSEVDNANLRMERAFQVSEFLQSHAVPDSPDGEPGAPSTVCTPFERTRDRAVLIKLKPAPKQPKEKCDPKPPGPKDPDDPCKATHWQIRIKPLSLTPPKLPAGVTGQVLFAELTMIRSDVPPRTADLIFAGGGQGLSTPNPIPLGVCTETVQQFDTFSPKGFSDFQGAGLSVFINVHVKNVSQLGLPPPTNPAAIDTSGFCFPPSLSEGTLPGRWILGFNPCPTQDDIR